MNILLLVLIILLIVGGLPNLGLVQHPYGYGPSSVGGVLLIVLIVLLLTGRL